MNIELRKFSPGNISIVYLYAIGFIIFALWIPDLWINWTTHRATLNIDVATRAIVAVGLVTPLLTGTFDLSIAGTISLSSVMVSWLQAEHGVSITLAIIITLLIALGCGALNAVLIVGVRMNSFIATLGTGAVLAALAEYVTGGVQITGYDPNFKKLAINEIFGGIQLKVLILVIITVILWYVIEHTPTGRYLQATGDGPDAARLAGVQTSRYVAGSLLVSAFIAGVGGILAAAQTAGNATAGAPFLLPAFAAAFLGSTQFKGRFNAWGTVASVFVLASMVAGLNRAISSTDIRRILDDLFFGLALIAAVGLSSLLTRYREYSAFRSRVRGAHEESDSDQASVPSPDET
ncbi:MAG: ABC transporter permease [Acidimicrobiales bacterium]